jgi:hypothetical protein
VALKNKLLLGAVLVAGAGLVSATALAADGDGAEPGFAVKPFAGETVVPIANVPAWVLHTANTAAPDAEWTSVELDQDDIEAVYELIGTGFGTDIELDVRPDGSLEEIELTIEPAEVPAAAAELFTKSFPGFTTTKIEKSVRPTRTGVLETWFEWDGTTSGGLAVDVEVDATGSMYLVEPD